MQLTTLRFRIKDSSSAARLQKMGWSVNFVWNFCNQTSKEQWTLSRNFLSAFDMHKLTSGCSKELGLHSQTVQAICDEHAKSRQQQQRSKLSWRSKKRSLGWIPFRGI